MKKKLLIITPHLSTGGAPQVTVNKIKLLKDTYEIKCIEYHCISWNFLVQKNRIIDLLGTENLITLFSNHEVELFKIIDSFQPEIISLEEFPEFFMDDSISKRLYSDDRKYKIFETTHDSSFPVSSKKWIPDKFIFVSAFNAFRYINFDVPYEIIEYPVDKKIKNKTEYQNKLGLEPDWKHVLNVGLFTPRKNQKYLFEIAEKLKDYKIKFHFIGNQAANFESYWKPLMFDKPENCIVWGERNDVEDFINACDLFFFASKGDRNNKELNPIAIKEALEYEIPLLMFNLDVYCGKYNKNKNVHYLSGNLEHDCKMIFDIINPKPMKYKDELILIGTYPNTNERKRLTKECINSYKSLGRKILLLSHYPVSEDIQEIVDYYVYDKENPLTYHSYYNLFFNKTTNYDVNMNINGLKTSNQSLTVYTNLLNGFKIAQDLGYSKVFYTTFDVVLSSEDYSSIDFGFEKLNNLNGYLSNIPNPLGKGVETTAMWFNTDFFLSKFKDIRTPEEYNNLCSSYNSHNFLEHFMFKVLENEPTVTIVDIEGYTLLQKSGRGVSSNSEYYSILPIENEENKFMFYFFTYNNDNRIINVTIKENNQETHNVNFKISEKKEYMRKLEYVGNEIELIISFIDNNQLIKKESYKINEFNLNDYKNTGVFIDKKKPKIKLVHLQTTRNDERERLSYESVSKLQNFGIDYVLHKNIPYTSLPPSHTCLRPDCVSFTHFTDPSHPNYGYALTPSHYGCYESFKNGILSEFSDDVDFLIVCEGDCIIEVPYEEFMDKLYKVCPIIKSNDIGYFSFGDVDTLDFGWKQSEVVEEIPNQDLLFITNKIIGLQCIMFPKKIKPFLFKQLLEHKWDAADMYFNTIFVDNNVKMGILKERITTQADGESLIDKTEKIFRKK